MTVSELAARALMYAERGYHVFPCDPGDKLPHLVHPSQPWRLKWGDRATTDPDDIKAWWSYSPTANIGIAVKPSGLLVVDIDEGPGKVGLEAFDALCERYSLAQAQVWNTYTVRTPRGGYHLYFKWPEGVQASQASIAKDVDVRCNGGQLGGYVLAPPSVTEHGTYYVEFPRQPVEVPFQLFELVKDRPRPQVSVPMGDFTGPANFQGLVDTVRCAPEGQRVFVLHWAANRIKDDKGTEAQAMDLLIPAALEAGLDEQEARGVIQRTHIDRR